TDLYEPATADRLLLRLRAMLAGFVTDAGRPLAEVEIGDADEFRRVTGDWNRTAHPLPDGCIHHAFERIARARPDAVAIECGDGGTVTYGGLNARANRIAHRLRRLGARPEARVGVCMRRTPDLVAAMLGVMKS